MPKFYLDTEEKGKGYIVGWMGRLQKTRDGQNNRKGGLSTGGGSQVDLYPQNDAASAADLASVGGWAANGVTLNVSSDAIQGIHSLNLESYAPGGQDYMEKVNSTLTQGKTYQLNFKSKFIPGGLPSPLAVCGLWLGVVASPNIELQNDLDWTSHTAEFTVNQSSVYFRFWVVADSHDGTGDTLLIDEITVYDITPPAQMTINSITES